MAAGLQTSIWNNNFKSMILLGTYPLIIMGMLWLIAYAVAYSQGGYHMERYDFAGGTTWLNTGNPEYVANNILYTYWPAILAVIIGWFLISYFFHTSMINKLSHAHPVERSDEPELYNLLENLCIAEGMTMPKLNIIETHARNAFASGINEKSYAITVTRGLMNSLTKDELEAVLGHELAHILNRDVRLLMVTVIFTGMIGFAAQMVWSSIRYGRIYSSRDKGGGALIILAIAVILWVGYLATLFMRFAISRRREYMADAGSVRLTKNPEAMMRALMRIAGKDKIPQTTGDIMMMCIENAHPFMGLFATHPPIEKRIAVLAEMTNTPVPELASLPPAQPEERYIPQKQQNPWLTRGRRG